MKAKTILMIFLILFLIGCGKERIVYVNQTLTEIKEVPIPCPKVECPEVKDCPKCPECIENTTIGKKLTYCYIRLDELNKEYFKCLNMNNTQWGENCSNMLDKCQEREEILQQRLDNITDYVKGFY